ncbi:MAG: hypothetical protein ACREUQ_06915 [Burkholderiales bacterium]
MDLDDYTRRFVERLRNTVATSNDRKAIEEAALLLLEVLGDAFRKLPDELRAGYIAHRLASLDQQGSDSLESLVTEGLLRDLAFELGLPGGESPESFWGRKRPEFGDGR